MSAARAIFLEQNWWKVLIPVVLVAGCVYLGITILQDAWRVGEQGVTGEAVVVESGIRRKRRSGSATEWDYEYFLRYRFTPPGGETIERRKMVSQAVQSRTHQGQRIPVRYLPEDPAVHEISEGGLTTSSYVAFLFAAIIAGLGVFFNWREWKGAAHLAALRARGRHVIATVAGATKAKSSTRIDYWFTDASGARCRGIARVPHTDANAALVRGNSVEIVFDPEEPENNLIASTL